MKEKNANLRQQIRHDFPERLRENHAKLCAHCKFLSWTKGCNIDILPVTSDGKDCIYYQIGVENENRHIK